VKYRHGFHAGNFADVHKHVTLLSVIAALQRKDKGFLYLETHAGRGLYDLGSAATHQGAEARLGIGVLSEAPAASPQISAYLAAIEQLRARAPEESAHYPGSPLLAAQALRPQDRGWCFEIQAAECRALERALQPFPRMRCECTDGYRGLASHFPPAERRALLFIDPPYEEQGDDLLRAIAAIDSALQRLANAVRWMHSCSAQNKKQSTIPCSATAKVSHGWPRLVQTTKPVAHSRPTCRPSCSKPRESDRRESRCTVSRARCFPAVASISIGQ